MSDYKELRKAIKYKSTYEDFDELNQRIEKIISYKSEFDSDKIKKTKSLICHFEGKINNANFYSVTAISCAVIIGVISIVCNVMNMMVSLKQDKKILDNNLIFIGILCLVLIVLIVVLIIWWPGDYKDTFILKALNFKLDELNIKSESNKKVDKKNKTDSSNQKNTANNLDETRNYREYVVRVYNK